MYAYRLYGQQSLIFSVLASSALDRGFESQSGQTKDYQISVLLLLHTAHKIKEQEQNLGGLESG
jgi:hypothetical protein